MPEIRPVKLEFFDETTTWKFTDLCKEMNINVITYRKNGNDIAETTPLKDADRRKLMSRWAEIQKHART
jgi:hypothetical protein